MKFAAIPHFYFLIILGSISAVISWPSGAPEKTCDSLLPKHGENRAKSANSSPYILTQSHQEYEAGERIKVTLNAPKGASFKGLIVQAYDPHTNAVIGKFEAGTGLKTIDSCSAVTHTDRRGKRSATLVWTAPNTSSGTVAFRGSIVQRFSEFFTGLQSSVDPNI